MKLFYLCFLLSFNFLYAETITEKKESLLTNTSDLGKKLEDELTEVNKEIYELKDMLRVKYNESVAQISSNTPPSYYKELLTEMKKLRDSIEIAEEKWKASVLKSGQEVSYALWHEPETTLGQLIVDYGRDYVYLIPNHAAALSISVNSHLPVPVQCWDEMLELILSNLGFGIKQLNPYLRQIVTIKDEPLTITTITNNFQELDKLPSNSRICFILESANAEPSVIFPFLSRVANPEKITLNLVGKSIFIIAQVQEIKQIVTMLKYLDISTAGREYKLIPIYHMSAEEMAKALAAYFTQDKAADAANPAVFAQMELKIVPMNQESQSIFLVGSRDQIIKAENIITEIMDQMRDPKEKILYCYTCKHSKAEEVSEVLERVYALMVTTASTSQNDNAAPPPNYPVVQDSCCGSNNDAPLVVSPRPISSPVSGDEPKLKNIGENFIVDPKNGSIIMVLEKEYLQRIKELLKELDVPKKMVRIEVLLFEKRMTEEDRFGLNLLKMGSLASNTNNSGLFWNDLEKSHGQEGIMAFFLSRTRCHGIPAFDMAYNFLLAQENVQINACPSVTTINQTPATIALVEEISVNNGVVVIDGDCPAPFLKDSYSRAQYGITIEITPTIHLEHDCLSSSGSRYITLDTDITFDTPQPSKVSRPDVTRRNIKNQVRIPDGQTVILGGLRRKTTHDKKEAIPFLGEIPGFGKFFSQTSLSDSQTEMFIFLTPKIIDDTPQDLEWRVKEELCKRPGDIPEYLYCLEEARRCDEKKLFEGGLKLLFGRCSNGS